MYQDKKDPKKNSHTFHPKNEGWGGKDELTLEVEFDEIEIDKLWALMQKANDISHSLPWAKESGLAREYVVSSDALHLPWAYNLQHRDKSITLVQQAQEANKGYLAPFTSGRLDKAGFTLEILGKVITYDTMLTNFLLDCSDSESSDSSIEIAEK